MTHYFHKKTSGMKARCDQFTNVIHVCKNFICENGIKTIKLSTIDSEMNIAIGKNELDKNDETIKIIYPPTTHLLSETIKIIYESDDKETTYSESIDYQPWSLEIASVNSRIISGTAVKNTNFIIRPIKLVINNEIVPYKTESIEREIRTDGMEKNTFNLHLQKQHGSTDIIEAYIDNYGRKHRIKYLARQNDFAFHAELLQKNKLITSKIQRPKPRLQY